MIEIESNIKINSINCIIIKFLLIIFRMLRIRNYGRFFIEYLLLFANNKNIFFIIFNIEKERVLIYYIFK